MREEVYRGGLFQESGERRKAWDLVKTPGALEELERISPEEKMYIDALSIKIFKETLALRMCIGKPWGEREYSQDFRGKTLVSRLEKPQEWFKAWKKYVVPEGIGEYLAGRENGTVIVFEAGKRAPDWRVMYYHGVTSQHVNKIDGRNCTAEYAFLAPANGDILAALEAENSAKDLRFLPLAIMQAGRRFAKNEEDARYFDGSIVGPHGSWRDPRRKKENSIMLIDLVNGLVKKVPNLHEEAFTISRIKREEIINKVTSSSVAKNGKQGSGSALIMERYWDYE